ncbi:ALDH-like protein [Aureobasidium sp. EXF-12298]|nr:ALDH-like protein [Aureobasidium sp. EXF-12298]KAI4765689.1 ALDH-like protein [Aureobasidium sp. EXF-12344]KAI4773750.1 ALDH-like protein [Aureobasidium sp. EXF-3400]
MEEALDWVSENQGTVALTWVAVVFATAVLWLATKGESEAAVDFEVPLPKQCEPGWQGEVLHEPSLKISGSSAVQCYCPATGQLLGVINPSTPDGIDRAIARAQDAQRTWALTTFSQRRKVLRTLLKYVLTHQDDIATAACLDSGKTRVDALFGEILVTAEKLKWTIDHGEKALQPSSRPTNLLMMYKSNSVVYEPLGVVAACVSWNYPFHNLLGPIISALFAGNAIVVKGSEQTAWCSVFFADIVKGALVACGHSPELVHAVTCWPTTAEHLTSHPGISHLTFIGSKPVAHHVCTSAAKALTPVVVELGGKDAAIILDAPNGKPMGKSELQRIESIIMRGVFQSAGQNCIGIERVVAMPLAYDYLLSVLPPRIRSLRLGNALTSTEVDVGAQVSPANFGKLESLIAEAVSQGAILLAGGKRHSHPEYPQGHYFTPTLLAEVTPEMRIAQEECFAPICLLMRAETVDHAISITNSTIYGLGCSVFGPASSPLHHVASSVKSGMVAINDFAAYYAVQLPFGGVGGSGYGRFAGEEGLRGLCNAKSVCVDRWPSLIKTAIPAGLDYPMRPTAWEMGKGVVELGYEETLMRKIRGLKRMLGGM